MTRIQVLAAASIAVAVFVLALKFAAYYVTGSIALYSDALESGVNVVGGCAALYAIRVGASPPMPAIPTDTRRRSIFRPCSRGR